MMNGERLHNISTHIIYNIRRYDIYSFRHTKNFSVNHIPDAHFLYVRSYLKMLSNFLGNRKRLENECLILFCSPKFSTRNSSHNFHLNNLLVY